jgi:hypothetical protein
MVLKKRVLDAIEQATGQTVQQLRNMSIDEQRVAIEKKHRKPMRFYSAFPFIGRGSIMGDKIISHADLEKLVSKALR